MTWLGRLLHRQKMEEQLDKEMRFHLDQHTRDLIARGLTPEEARRQANIAFGGAERMKEDCRDARGTRWLEDLGHDVRYAFRTLASRAGFATVAVLTLALGIGASTAIFSAVNPILFEPLPYSDSGRIVSISDIGAKGATVPVTFGNFTEIKQRSRSFQWLAVSDAWQPAATGADQPERFEGNRVSADYFRVLAVKPRIGRDFTADDDRYKGPNVVILSDGLWRRYCAGDPAIVGKAITLDGNLFTVIGVMPAGYEKLPGFTGELWAPRQYDSANLKDTMTAEWGHHMTMIGRLRSGVGLEQARSEMATISKTQVPEFPRPTWSRMENGMLMTSLRDDMTRAVKPALLAVLGAVLLVLVIACVNVTNLLLAQGAQRRGEFAMRAALGALGTRLLRQVLTESVVLTVLGGGLGVLLAVFGVRTLVALSPPELPRLNAIRLDAVVLLFAAGITGLVGILVGLVPAMQASRHDPQLALQQSSLRSTGGRQAARRALVVAEVSLALVLLVSAGLLLRSMRQLFAVDAGFNAASLLTMEIQESGHRYDQDEARLRFFDQALLAVRALPGVTTAGLTQQLPLSGDLQVYGASFDMDREGDDIGVVRYAITPGYMEAMQIPLRRGRYFTEQDMAPGAPRVAIISEATARQKFGNADPIGRRVCVRCQNEVNKPWSVIVGVVGDVRQVSLALSDGPQVYQPSTQWFWAEKDMSLVVRAQGDVVAMTPAIKSAIWSVDRDQPIVRVATMQELVDGTAAQRRFTLTLFEGFGLAALALATIGIYGVLAGSVTERMREIGVRTALGATRRDIVGLVLRQGMVLTGIGLVIGLAGAMAATRTLITLLFGTSPLDPATYAGVALVLVGASALASWVPAWRAARVDPAITLRSE